MARQPAGRLSGLPAATARWAVSLILDLVLHRRHCIHCYGRSHFRPNRPTLIVTNHRRDTDGPLVATMLLARRGLRFSGPLPHFVAREDLMRQGFLRRYMTSWPDWIRALVGWLSLARFLRILNVHPMRRFPEQTLGEVLADVSRAFGDLPLDEVLKPAWVRRFQQLDPGAPGPDRVSEARSRRYHALLETPYGLRRLTLAGFRRIKPYQRRTVAAQIAEVVEHLERGRPVHFVPEGRISSHGWSLRVREGTYRLLAAGGPELAVLPMGIAHDDVNVHKPRIFLVMGEALAGLRTSDRAEVDRTLYRALHARQTLTLSQIASARVLARPDGDAAVTAAALDGEIAREAERLQGLGAPVDPLVLDPEQRRNRLGGFLRFCVRHGLMAEQAGGYRLCREALTEADPWCPQGRLPYAANELAELAAFWGHSTGEAGQPAEPVRAS